MKNLSFGTLFVYIFVLVFFFQLFQEPIHFKYPFPRYKYTVNNSYFHLSKFIQRAYFHDGYVYYECSDTEREQSYMYRMSLNGKKVEALGCNADLGGLWVLPNNTLLLLDEFYVHERCSTIIYDLNTRTSKVDRENIYCSLAVLNGEIYGYQQHGTGFRKFSLDFENYEKLNDSSEQLVCLHVYKNNIYALDNRIREKEDIFDEQSDLYIYSPIKKDFVVICENGIDYFIDGEEIYYIDNRTRTIMKKLYYEKESTVISKRKVENMRISDGTIFFLTCEHGLLHDENFLYTMNLDGSNCKKLCKYEEDYIPHFYEQNGYYITQNKLMSVSASGEKRVLKKVKWGGKVESAKPFGVYYYEECKPLMQGETFKVYPIH